MRRQAEKAGSWYPAGAKDLAAEVDGCVRNARERYGAAIGAGKGSPAGIMAPHAGLFFSGAVAAAGFELVRERLGRVDTFVVFGACHRAALAEPAVWTTGEWETPLGSVMVDEEFAADLLAVGAGREDFSAHAGDNAIELQMPFIKRLFPEARIVPVAMGFFSNASEIGALAAGVARRRGGVNVAVASTDLTHYGAAFGVMPAGTGERALAWIRRNDEKFLSAVSSMDGKGMVDIARRDGSACGAGAVAGAAGWSKAFGCEHGRVLAYTNSYDIMPRGEADHVVGYASAVFETDAG